VRRTARLPEVDYLESGRRPSDRSKMPLRLLNKVEQCVAAPIGRGQGSREPPLERHNRGNQVAPMMDRAGRGA
jgi:hypothetical protein